jgi:hypothetical protein
LCKTAPVSDARHEFLIFHEWLQFIIAALHRSPIALIIGSLNLRDDAGGLFASVISGSRCNKKKPNEKNRCQKL